MKRAAAFPAIAAGILLIAARSLAADPVILGLPPGALERARQMLATNAAPARAALDSLMEEADRALKLAPPSVMDKPAPPASGDKHDYSSQAPYFWPDPTKPNGRPYIRKDGQRNPESGNSASDAPRMGRMATAVETLAYAWQFTGKRDYAERAAKLLRVWFLDAATRMNPNLNHAQAIPGVNTGRGIGMIESRSLTRVMDGIRLIDDAGVLSAAERTGLDQWMERFLDWALQSKNGRDEQAAKNNHGTFYDVQVTHLALFVGRTNLAVDTLESAKQRRIAAQIRPDGSQPLELARVDSFGYSRFNLQAHIALANLGRHAGVDLWHYKTPEGAGLQQAINFLLPYALDPEKKWPYEHGKKQDRHLHGILQPAYAIYRDDRYLEALRQTPGVGRWRDSLFHPVP